jgi:hypothetical protein
MICRPTLFFPHWPETAIDSVDCGIDTSDNGFYHRPTSLLKTIQRVARHILFVTFSVAPRQVHRSEKYVISSRDRSTMELGTTPEANRCVATLQFLTVLWNPKVHYSVHKSSPLVPILSQTHTNQITLHFLSQTHINIIHPPTSWYS